MVQLYNKKTWNQERILDTDMNRMENACSGRVFHVAPNGTDGDFDTIQAAIDKCELDGQGTVVLKPGVYTLDAKLTIQGDYIALMAGGDATLKKGVNLNDDILEIGQAGTAAKFTLLRGIIFDGNKANQTGGDRDIDILRAENLVIDQCLLKNSYKDAIRSQAQIHKNIWIKNNYFTGMEERPIYIAGGAIGSRTLKILNNKMDSFKKAGIYINPAEFENVDVVGNHLYCDAQTAEYGMYMGTNIVNVRVSGNHIMDALNEALYVVGYQVHLIDNLIDAPGGDGIRAQIMSGVIGHNEIVNGGKNGIKLNDGNMGVVVVGNKIWVVNEHGIYLVTDTTSPVKCQVVGNLIEDCSQAAHNTYSGIKLDIGQFCGIHGNHIVATGVTRHQYGIDENGTKNHVVANSSHGHVTANVLVAGAGSINSGNTGTV